MNSAPGSSLLESSMRSLAPTVDEDPIHSILNSSLQHMSLGCVLLTDLMKLIRSGDVPVQRSFAYEAALKWEAKDAARNAEFDRKYRTEIKPMEDAK